MFQRLSKSSFLAAWMVVLCAASAIAAKQNEAKQKPAVEMATCQVQVFGSKGQPVAGATIYPRGLRTKIKSGRWWNWDEEKFGKRPEKKTDKQGMVVFSYPKFVTEKMEVGKLWYTVSHPDYVSFDNDKSVDELAIIALKDGFRILATAVDAETGQRIPSDLFAETGFGQRTRWKFKNNGMMVSNVLPKKAGYVRLIHAPKDQPARFSDLLEIDATDQKRVSLKNVKLKRGTRVEGKLDPAIPRPIKNGIVAIYIVRRNKESLSTWTWSDFTSIAADGTFVFESLPPGELMQAIPSCDGWVTKQPSKEAIKVHFPDLSERGTRNRIPQLVPLRGELVKPILKMVPAVATKVSVRNSENQPVNGAMIRLYPQESWFQLGSSVLGTSQRTMDRLRANRQRKNYRFRPPRIYRAITDENGIASFPNMPPTYGDAVQLTHSEYELPLEDGHRSPYFSYQAPKHRIELTVQKIGVGPRMGTEKAIALEEAKKAAAAKRKPANKKKKE